MENTPPSVLEVFAELKAPRTRECEHKLEELLLAICALISDAESWSDCTRWGIANKRRKVEWDVSYLRLLLDL